MLPFARKYAFSFYTRKRAARTVCPEKRTEEMRKCSTAYIADPTRSVYNNSTSFK